VHKFILYIVIIALVSILFPEYPLIYQIGMDEAVELFKKWKELQASTTQTEEQQKEQAKIRKKLTRAGYRFHFDPVGGSQFLEPPEYANPLNQ